jgi:predicted AlkP superfamily pyrophosphatase or phosphodiesterase
MRRSLPLLLLASALLAACAGEAPASPDLPARPADAVVLVSLDGVGPELVARTETPHLDALARRGLRARRLVPPFPSLTFPAHATLATGRFAAGHGIVSNRFRDRATGETFSLEDESRWLRAEPLWITATRQGVETHLVHWPCSQGAWDGLAPASALPYDEYASAGEKAARILDHLRRGARPLLVLSYWEAADGAGHEEGPLSEAAREALRGSDEALGRLLRGIEALPDASRVAVVVVSDHGMIPLSWRLSLVAERRPRGLDYWVEASGPLANLYLESASEAGTVAASLDSLPGLRCRRLEELPARYHYGPRDRAGEVVCEAEPGGSLGVGRRRGRQPSRLRGMHGYDPEEEDDMAALFVAAGAGLPEGAVRERLEAVDVHPLVAGLLGIRPAEGVRGRSPLAGRQADEGSGTGR